MALTAHFTANFSSFEAAVQKAEVKLRAFEDDAQRVTKSLDRMSNSLSGTRLIQDANLMAAAVDRIGGTSKLTDNELRRLGGQASEAAEKMSRLGLKVPENLQRVITEARKLDDAIKAPTDRLSSMLGTVSKVAGAVGIAFGTSQIIAFGKSILDDLGHLEDLHETTDISREDLQRLGVVAESVGSNMDDVALAVFNLSKRIADGSADVAQFGLSAQALLTAGPKEAFVQIAEGVSRIENPMLRNTAAADLLGDKVAKKLIPALGDLRQRMADVSEQELFTDQDVKDADAFGEALERLVRISKVTTVRAVRGFGDFFRIDDDTFLGIKGLSDELPKVAAAVKVVGDQIDPLPAIFDSTSDAVKALSKGLKEEVDAAEKLAKAQADAIEAQKRFIDSIRDATVAANLSVVTLNRYGATTLPNVSSAFADARRQAVAFIPALDDVSYSVEELQRQGRFAAAALQTLSQRIITMPTGGVGRTLAKELEDAGKAADDLRDKFTALWEGISGGNGLKGVFQNLGKGIIDQFGALITGGITTLISKGIALLGKGLGKLFGIDRTWEEVNDLRDAFVDAAGGLEELNVRAHNAGITLDHLLDARTPEAYQKAIEELNAAFEFQDDAMRTLDETVKKYGFSLDQLGPTLQRQELGKKFSELYQDFQLLTSAGVDHVAITQQMSESVSQYVQDAVRMGIEVPRSMQKMLEEFAANGDLLDENGNKIEDLSAYGVTFAESMTQSVNKVVDAVQKLVDAITRGLNPAIAAVPAINVPVNYNDPGFVPGSWRTDDMPEWGGAQANGGDYFVKKPTLFLAGEAGPERVSFNPMTRNAATGSDVRQPVVIQVITESGRLLREQFIDDILKDKRGIGTKLRAAVA